MTKSYYPAFLDLSGRKCVVFGGGKVALRKVEMLLDFGAEVEVVSPECCRELEDLRDSHLIALTGRVFQPVDLDAAFLAVAATDDAAANRQISIEARRRRVLVNVVDTPDLCDFIAPSYLRRGDLTVAVSTSGASPALAKKVRTELEKQFGEEYSALSGLIGEVRSRLKRDGIRIDAGVWGKALDAPEILDSLRRGDVAGARSVLMNLLMDGKEAVRNER